jgi:glycosyltransferase involved in cell wall biosynthesis
VRIIVLQTMGGFAPDGSAGGGVTHFVRLCGEWAKMGNQVVLVTNSGDKGSSRYSHFATTHVLPAIADQAISIRVSFITQSLVNHVVQRRPLAELCRELNTSPRPSVVLATSPAISDILAARFLARNLRSPGVVYFHHATPPFWWHPRRRGGLARAFGIHCLAQTGLLAVKLSSLYPSFDNPKMSEDLFCRFPHGVIPHPGALEERDVAPNTRNVPRTIDACFLGRIAESKGIVDLLTAWKLVVARRPGSHLVLGGSAESGRGKLVVTRLLSDPALRESVTALGLIAEVEKRRLLSQSRLFLFPSYEEGWSIAVMEAVTLGALPIIYDLRAYDYLGSSAPRVPVGSTTQFAEAVLKFLNDQVETQRVNDELKRQIVEFSISNVARQELEILSSLPCEVPPRPEPVAGPYHGQSDLSDEHRERGM